MTAKPVNHHFRPANPPFAGRAGSLNGSCAGFTLIETLIALAIVAIALMALLGLHHQSLQSVIRAEQITQAAFLAQRVITEAEMEQFPQLGDTSGDFEYAYKGKFKGYKWRRVVEAIPLFPDVRKVIVVVYYGPNFSRSFELAEAIHNPLPH